VLRETRQRLHQPVFRSTVLRAYERRCAVCSLAHSELLDAAHIVADSDERGEASVRNRQPLMVLPRTRRERPAAELLQIHYDTFRGHVS
jgi:hypothetical protein